MHVLFCYFLRLLDACTLSAVGLVETSTESASEESLNIHELCKLIKGERTASAQNGHIPNARSARFVDDSLRLNERVPRNKHSGSGDPDRYETVRMTLPNGDVEKDELVEGQHGNDRNMLVEVDLHDNHVSDLTNDTDIATSQALRGQELQHLGEDADLDSATENLL